jgi:hypothetical protein
VIGGRIYKVGTQGPTPQFKFPLSLPAILCQLISYWRKYVILGRLSDVATMLSGKNSDLCSTYIQPGAKGISYGFEVTLEIGVKSFS